MEEVIDDPEKNEKKYLEKRAKDLNKMSDAELQELFAQRRRKSAKWKGRWMRIIKKKTHHHVK